MTVAVSLVIVAVVALGCSSSPTRDAATFCSSYTEVARQGSRLANPDDVAVATLRSQVHAIDDAATAAAKTAPEDIADAVDAVVEPLGTLRKGLDDAGDRADALAALDRYRADAAKLSADQDRLDTWVAHNCGMVPVTSTTTPVTIQPSPTS